MNLAMAIFIATPYYYSLSVCAEDLSEGYKCMGTILLKAP